jgi:NADH:ubiquinone reductase (non-electrogenic)
MASSSSRALSKLAGSQHLVSATAKLPQIRPQKPVASSARLLTTAAPCRRPGTSFSPRRAHGGKTAPTTFTREFRRGYADEAAAASSAPAPASKKPRRLKTLRWVWRVTYLSFLGGVVYIGYGVYLDRHPAPQMEPDPKKKTLVILGESRTRFFLSFFMIGFAPCL